MTRRESDHLTDRISLGVSHGDGTLHIGFDQHDNPLHYRVSKAGVATNPGKVKWTSDIFGPTLVSAPPSFPHTVLFLKLLLIFISGSSARSRINRQKYILHQRDISSIPIHTFVC